MSEGGRVTAGCVKVAERRPGNCTELKAWAFGPAGSAPEDPRPIARETGRPMPARVPV